MYDIKHMFFYSVYISRQRVVSGFMRIVFSGANRKSREHVDGTIYPMGEDTSDSPCLSALLTFLRGI